MPVLSTGSVPAATRSVKTTSVKTALCTECWQEFRPGALRTFYGRELCPACLRAEEEACYGAQEAQQEAMDWGFAAVRSDRMDRLGDVLHGMGF